MMFFSIFFNALAAAGNTLLYTNKNFGLLGITLSFIFFGSLSNELILDMRDVEGDNNNHIVTIPTFFNLSIKAMSFSVAFLKAVSRPFTYSALLTFAPDNLLVA